MQLVKQTLKAFTILLLLTSLAFSGQALFKQYRKQKNVETEINALKTQAAEYNQQNQTLTQSLEFLQTSAYKERIARESLNMKAEGEVAVSFIPQSQAVTPVANTTSAVPNPIKWWYYFFKNDK